MSGKAKVEIFVYNNKGHFIESFDSQTSFRKQYFPDDIGKRPLLLYKERFKSLYKKEDIQLRYGCIEDLYFFEERVYREDIVFLDRIHNSEFCKKEESKEVEVFNLLGEKIAEFKNRRLLTKMMPHIKESFLSRELTAINKKVKRHSELGLFFKYKD